MATISEIQIQMIITFLLLPTVSNSKNSTGIWLLNLRQTEGISVYPDGHFFSSTSDPTLYNLFRVQTYQRRFSSPLTFTMESMATNTFICMDTKGNLITKARITEPPVAGRKQKRSPPSHLCVFRSWNFGISGDWNQMVGIYMEAPRSNGTKGFFIAFNKNGEPRRYRRHFSKLTKSLNILITMHKPKSIRKLIRKTRFQRCDGVKGSRNFNRSVRRCLEAEPDLLLPNKIHRKNLLKIIHRCQKEVERSFCSTLRQHSGTKRSTDDTSVNNGTLEEVNGEEPCHCLGSVGGHG